MRQRVGAILAFILAGCLLVGAAGKDRPQPVPLPGGVSPALTPEQQRINGSVVLKVRVDPDGVPRNIRVLRSLGHGLDEKAVEAVSSWRFQPATFEGKPVAKEIAISVDFGKKTGKK